MIDSWKKFFARSCTKSWTSLCAPGVIEGVWNRVKLALESEVQLWNENCDKYYDAASTKILFHRNPFMAEQMKSLATMAKEEPAGEWLRDWLAEPDFSGVPRGSVCAETVRKDVTGKPKVRVYVWLTQGEPQRIMYCYGQTCNHNKAMELPVRVEAGLLEHGGGESDFAKRSVRDISVPLMEAA
jgi:hypothetical protein